MSRPRSPTHRHDELSPSVFAGSALHSILVDDLQVLLKLEFGEELEKNLVQLIVHPAVNIRPIFSLLRTYGVNLIFDGGMDDRIFSYALNQQRISRPTLCANCAHLEVLDRLDGELHLNLTGISCGFGVERGGHVVQGCECGYFVMEK